MGNCCGTPSKSSQAFSGEGRTLGAQPTTAAPPSGSAKISSASPGRTLGSSPQAPNTTSSLSPAEAARKAAEDRASASQSQSQAKGKLGKALSAQQSQTQSNTLQQNARETLAARNADAARAGREYN